MTELHLLEKSNRMSHKNIIGSLSGIVDKMNETYNFIGGFSLGVNRRVVPVIVDGEVSGWKMQRHENDAWVDLDEMPFKTMEELIAHYKDNE